MSTGNTNDSFIDSFASYVDSAMKLAVQKAFDDAIEQAVKDAEKVRDETVAAMALKLSSRVNMQDLGTTLRIEITKPEPDHA